MQELHRFTVALLARLYRELHNNIAASELMEKYLQSSIFTYSSLHLNYLQVFIDLLSRSLSSQGNSITPVTIDAGLIDVNKICTTFSWAFKIIAKSRVFHCFNLLSPKISGANLIGSCFSISGGLYSVFECSSDITLTKMQWLPIESLFNYAVFTRFLQPI